MGDGMSFVTRVYEVVVAVEELLNKHSHAIERLVTA